MVKTVLNNPSIENFAIHFDYTSGKNPRYNNDPDAKYTNVYIVEFNKNDKIDKIIDLNENEIDMFDTKNSDLIERIKKSCYIDQYDTYDIARNNMIYIIYFDHPEFFSQKQKLNKYIYSLIVDNFSYTGKNYYYDSNGNILRECFHINGKIEGKFIGYYSFSPYNPQYEIDYVNGVIHGKYLKKYRDGQIHIECNFVDGKIIGKMCSYYNDSSLALECNYLDGKIEGSYVVFSERNYTVDRYNNRHYSDTISVKITNYENDKENGKRCIYRYSFSKNTYDLISECDYVNGQKDGIKNMYNTDGKIIRTITYKNNKKHGLSTYMGKTKYRNGYYIKIEKTYKDGYRTGINKYYNDLGHITMTKLYKGGRVYNISEYYSTAVKKISIDITYDDKPFYTVCNMCTKENHKTIRYNESEEIISIKKEKKIIEHDGYEMCGDSDYYEFQQDDDFYEKKKYICFNEYEHFVNIL